MTVPFPFLAPPEKPGEIGRLGQFRVLELLGEGGMGLVFRAEDTYLGRQVALKVVRPELAARPDCRQRFLREARSAAAVEHERIVPILQVGEADGNGQPMLYLAMPLLRGRSLEDRLRKPPPLTSVEVLELGRQVAEGLAAAHAAGLIHRDIKPSNLWLESRGQGWEQGIGDRGQGIGEEKKGGGKRAGASPSSPLPPSSFRSSPVPYPLSSDPCFDVKLLDFGLARLASDDDRLTGTSLVVGTPSYMAPEQINGRPEPASDLFSLGCVLYEAATGRVPFRGACLTDLFLRVATEEPAPPGDANPRIPPALSELIVRLLTKDPRRRPGSAHDVVRELTGIAARTAAAPTRADVTLEAPPLLPPHARPDAATILPAPSSPPRRRRASWPVVAAMAVLLGGLAAAAVLVARPVLTSFAPPPTPLTSGEPSGPPIDVEVSPQEVVAVLTKAPAGSSLRLRPGDYRVSLEVARPIELVGPPTGEAIFRPGDRPAVRSMSVGVVIRNLVFHGGATPQATVSGTGNELTARNCTFREAGGPAIVAEEEGRLTLEGCTVAHGKAEGVAVRDGASAVLRRCMVREQVGAGLALRRAMGTVESGTSFWENAGCGIDAADGSRVTLTGCDLRANRPWDVRLRRESRASSDRRIVSTDVDPSSRMEGFR